MSSFLDFHDVFQCRVSGGSVVKIAYLSKEDSQDVRKESSLTLGAQFLVFISIFCLQSRNHEVYFKFHLEIYPCTRLNFSKVGKILKKMSSQAHPKFYISYT